MLCTSLQQVLTVLHLKGLQLAHLTENENFEISVLIGADYYWSFVHDHVTRGDGPTVVQSRLGYLLSGLIYMPSKLNSWFISCICEIISEQESRGFIEQVQMTSSMTTVHYIPHHPVRKESSTTPIRIVYDCSYRQSQDQPSLNDCLMVGPTFLNDMFSHS